MIKVKEIMRQSTQKNLFGIQHIKSMENAKIEVGCNRWRGSDFAAHLLFLRRR